MIEDGDAFLKIVENPNAPHIYASGVAGCAQTREGAVWLTLYQVTHQFPEDPKALPTLVKRIAARLTLSREAWGQIQDVFLEEENREWLKSNPSETPPEE